MDWRRMQERSQSPCQSGPISCPTILDERKSIIWEVSGAVGATAQTLRPEGCWLLLWTPGSHSAGTSWDQLDLYRQCCIWNRRGHYCVDPITPGNLGNHCQPDTPSAFTQFLPFSRFPDPLQLLFSNFFLHISPSLWIQWLQPQTLCSWLSLPQCRFLQHLNATLPHKPFTQGSRKAWHCPFQIQQTEMPCLIF